jgi:hypothetical protein
LNEEMLSDTVVVEAPADPSAGVDGEDGLVDAVRHWPAQVRGVEELEGRIAHPGGGEGAQVRGAVIAIAALIAELSRTILDDTCWCGGGPGSMLFSGRLHMSASQLAGFDLGFS